MTENDEKIKNILIENGFEPVHSREQMAVEKYHFNLFNVVANLRQLEIRLSKQDLDIYRTIMGFVKIEILHGILTIAIILYLIFGK